MVLSTVKQRGFTSLARGGLMVAFILLLIPLLLIGQYNHPSADDFIYGLHTARIWSETLSLPQTLHAAVQQVQEVYMTWQGTFSAVFLMALQPAVFGEAMYRWTSVILLSSLIIATALFLKVLLIDYFGADRWSWLLISMTTLTAMLQFVYAPVESFYWYNGGIYYSFFYSLSLCLFSCLLLYLKSDSNFTKTFLILLSLFLGIIIGGGNYTTALNAVIMVALLTAYLVARKDRRAIIIGVVLLCGILSLLISMVAPGNAVRQESIGPPNPVKAIILSFVYGGYSVLNFTTVPVLLIWLFLLPRIYRIAGKTSFSFRYPLAVLALSFCVYCAQVTPPFYAMGISLPERIINIVYYSFHIFALVNLFYMAGWVSKKLDRQKQQLTKAQIEFIEQLKYKAMPYQNAAKAFLVMLILFSSIGLCTVTKGENGKPQFQNLPASVSATMSLLSGEAGRYHHEALQRLLAYQDDSQTDVTVSAYSVKPSLIYYSDITPDSSDWINRAVAAFYNKDTIKLQD